MASEDEHPTDVANPVPDTERVRLRQDVVYKTAGTLELTLDVYYPNDATTTPRPAVVFLHGDAAPEIVRNAKEWPQYVRWGERVASAGLIGVVANHRSTERGTKLEEAAQDVDDVIAFVRKQAADLAIDPDRLCLWTCSAGGPVTLRSVLRDTPRFVRAVVAYYCLLDLRHLKTKFAGSTLETLQAFSPSYHLSQSKGHVPAMLVVRAGRDSADINTSIDNFVALALTKNIPLEVVNHPTARHAFDVHENDRQSLAILERTVAFMREQLGT